MSKALCLLVIHLTVRRPRSIPVGQKITLAAAADELGISKRSVRRLISNGELRAYKIGRSGQLVRIDRDDLATVMCQVVPNGKP
ncbi:hypothetical protein BST30_08000 [Mycobacterium mantenii]|uniref:Helix-turn-helix domain-containing protein n=1 Tax=Mycobacterium mantenii TaxID=560555 RepID=A0A1X0G1F9_MYCNT|nr:hypothetical protein BST30_08000 [Mycobacterium mantenii]